MLILKDFAAGDKIIESMCNGDAWLSDVIFKDEFLKLLQKTLEHHKEKIVLFGKERNPTEVIELVKEIQSKQFHPNSRCDLVYCFSQGYFEIIFHSGNDDEDEYEQIELNLNLTDITKPILSITQ